MEGPEFFPRRREGERDCLWGRGPDLFRTRPAFMALGNAISKWVWVGHGVQQLLSPWTRSGVGTASEAVAKSQLPPPPPLPCQSYKTRSMPHTTTSSRRVSAPVLHPRSCVARIPWSPVAPWEGAQSRLWVTDATSLPEMFPTLITFLNFTNTISAPWSII